MCKECDDWVPVREPGRYYLQPEFSSEFGDSWGYSGWLEEAEIPLTPEQVEVFNKAFGHLFTIDDEPPKPVCPEEIKRNREASRRNFVEWGPVSFRKLLDVKETDGGYQTVIPRLDSTKEIRSLLGNFGEKDFITKPGEIYDH